MNTADLIASCQSDWDEYIHHRFVRELGDGTLPGSAFRHYLKQDYLFLMHFARAYGLAIYKSSSFAEMSKPLAALKGLIEHETSLHVAFCSKWGISEEEMMAVAEARGTIAYTRLVLDAGMSGSLVELYAGLAPCSIGYGEIGLWLAGHADTVHEGNPYREWIDMYSDEEYQSAARDSRTQLDEMLAEITASSQTGQRVLKTFRDAVRMEIAFWEQGYEG